MRNYLSYFVAIGALFFIDTSCTSPAAKAELKVEQNADHAKQPSVKPAETVRLSPTTRHPEPESGAAAVQRIRQEEQTAFPETSDLEKLEALLAKYNPATEVFTIDPTEATSITSSNGTQVYFQELAFIDEQGNTVTEPLTIELKVCDNQLAFLANNLVTETSDGKLLESGGMLHIEAILNGQKLALNPEKEALVLFPKSGTNLLMQSFHGVSDGDLVKWELTPPSLPEEREESVTEKEPAAKKDRSLHLRIHEFTAKLNDEDVHWILENTDESLLDWLEKQDINGTKLQSWLAAPGHRIQTKLHLNRRGKIKLMESDLVAHEDILDELQHLFDQAPALEMKSMSDYYNRTSLFLSFTGKKGVSDDQIRNRVKRKYGNFKAELVDDFTNKELNNYILEINQLGWHNCDHFKASDKKEDVLVKTDRQKPVKVILVFDDFKSQLAGKQTLNGWKFEELPLDINVRVLAFSFNGDQPLMANQSMRITDKELTITDFKPFSYNELEAAMKHQ